MTYPDEEDHAGDRTDPSTENGFGYAPGISKKESLGIS
jgi:hypothetical protein